MLPQAKGSLCATPRKSCYKSYLRIACSQQTGRRSSANPAPSFGRLLAWAAPAQALDPGVPAQVVPEQEVPAPAPAIAPASAPSLPVAAEPHTIMQLPNTATASPITALMALLLGLALTIHGLRRVRRAATQLERQSAALGRLATLAGAKAQRRSRMKKHDN